MGRWTREEHLKFVKNSINTSIINWDNQTAEGNLRPPKIDMMEINSNFEDARGRVRRVVPSAACRPQEALVRLG